MGSGDYAQLRKTLLAHGCYMQRQGKGSHELWFSPLTDRIFVVPSTAREGNTARAILKTAGIPWR